MLERAQPLAYRPKAAAEVLGVSRTTLYRMIAAGTIRTRKIGGATIISHADLASVIDGAPVTNAPPIALS